MKLKLVIQVQHSTISSSTDNLSDVSSTLILHRQCRSRSHIHNSQSNELILTMPCCYSILFSMFNLIRKSFIKNKTHAQTFSIRFFLFFSSFFSSNDFVFVKNTPGILIMFGCRCRLPSIPFHSIRFFLGVVQSVMS